jgi:predicted nucleic acid-binding Zn ribbon protein
MVIRKTGRPFFHRPVYAIELERRRIIPPHLHCQFVNPGVEIEELECTQEQETTNERRDLHVFHPVLVTILILKFLSSSQNLLNYHSMVDKHSILYPRSSRQTPSGPGCRLPYPGNPHSFYMGSR